MWEFWSGILLAGLVFGFAAARTSKRRFSYLLLLGPLLAPPLGWTVIVLFVPRSSPDDWIWWQVGMGMMAWVSLVLGVFLSIGFGIGRLTRV